MTLVDVLAFWHLVRCVPREHLSAFGALLLTIVFAVGSVGHPQVGTTCIHTESSFRPSKAVLTMEVDT